MKSLNGLFFYNSGPLSGFSQQHKHIQILPSEALMLPIINQILS
jgi:ATP adenylyltransferase/5',5'''-P-1,P-4-tetraphosphate phosphorylase II